MDTHLNQMVKVFEEFRYKHDLARVFEDFLSVAAFTISNSVDKYHYEKREAQYMQIISRYSKDEANKFAKLLALLVVALEHKPDDYLGRLFMQLELYNSWRGQFFTPYEVAYLMSVITLGDRLESKLKTGEPIKIYEPTVGGGVTVISCYSFIKSKGYNPQKLMQVVAQDIDSKAVHMTYIQLSLLGINATVILGNTLTLECREVWKTPGYYFGWGRGSYVKKEELVETPAEVESFISANGLEEVTQLTLF